jgi:hypothetical protein
VLRSRVRRGSVRLAKPKPAVLGFGQLATEYTWFPEEIDLLNGMALGAGLGAAVGGVFALVLRGVSGDRIAAVGTVVGIVIGVGAVAAGNLNLDFTALAQGPALVSFVVLVSAVLRALPYTVTRWIPWRRSKRVELEKPRAVSEPDRPSDRGDAGPAS